jgi:hypothetical protein
MPEKRSRVAAALMRYHATGAELRQLAGTAGLPKVPLIALDKLGPRLAADRILQLCAELSQAQIDELERRLVSAGILSPMPGSVHLVTQDFTHARLRERLLERTTDEPELHQRHLDLFRGLYPVVSYLPCLRAGVVVSLLQIMEGDDGEPMLYREVVRRHGFFGAECQQTMFSGRALVEDADDGRRLHLVDDDGQPRRWTTFEATEWEPAFGRGYQMLGHRFIETPLGTIERVPVIAISGAALTGQPKVAFDRLLLDGIPTSGGRLEINTYYRRVFLELSDSPQLLRALDTLK